MYLLLLCVTVRVHLWDLSGGTEYLDVRNEMYGGSDIVFLMFDVSNSGSFEGLENWMKEITKYASPAPEICLVANKVNKNTFKKRPTFFL